MIETAIIGAGPYGLSLAAHLAAAGVDFRIFGAPLTSWRAHMPKGMHAEVGRLCLQPVLARSAAPP